MYIGEVLKQVRRMQQDVFSAASAGLLLHFLIDRI